MKINGYLHVSYYYSQGTLGELSLQVGAEANQTIDFEVQGFSASSLGGSGGDIVGEATTPGNQSTGLGGLDGRWSFTWIASANYTGGWGASAGNTVLGEPNGFNDRWVQVYGANTLSDLDYYRARLVDPDYTGLETTDIEFIIKNNGL